MLGVLVLLGVAAVAAVPVFLVGGSAFDGDDPLPEERKDPDEPPLPPSTETHDDGTGDLLSEMSHRPPDGAAAPTLADARAEDAAEAAKPSDPAPDPAPETAPGLGDYAATLESVLDRIDPGPVLSPGSGDVADQGPYDPLTGPILTPGAGDMPDVPASDAVAAPVLAPGAGDAADIPAWDAAAPTAIVPDAADPQTVVALDGAPAEIDDFLPDEEVLEITLYTLLAPEDVVIAVAPSGDGADGVVSANDNVIAILRGAPGAGADSVRIAFERPPAT